MRNGCSLALHRSSPVEKFDDLLELFDAKIQSFFGDARPDCIVVCLPDELADMRISNPKLSAMERVALERLQREEEQEQMSLFQPTPEDLKAAEELRNSGGGFTLSHLLSGAKGQDHDPPKILCQSKLCDATPSYDQTPMGQSYATRAWNLATSLFYKSGHEPWRPADLPSNTCFIGISFHHLKRREGDVVYASVAQAFSNEIEPFALKGSLIPHEQRRDRQPYLTDVQAATLMTDVLDNIRSTRRHAPYTRGRP